MRKLIVIALLAVFCLPFASSLFALTPKSEANLPACCRRNGKHHCMVSTAQRDKLTGDKTGFSAPFDKCPYSPAAVVGVHRSIQFSPLTGYGIPSDALSHPTGVAQTLCKLRIARDRARGKRGPPATSIL